jgi:hypothetical protein
VSQITWMNCDRAMRKIDPDTQSSAHRVLWPRAGMLTPERTDFSAIPRLVASCPVAFRTRICCSASLAAQILPIRGRVRTKGYGMDAGAILAHCATSRARHAWGEE